MQLKPIDHLKTQKIGFIGAGNMATSIIHGLIKAEIASRHLIVSNPSNGKLNALVERYPALQVTTENQRVANASDIIILAVKPQKINQCLDSIKQLDLSNKLIISVAAGVTCSQIEGVLLGDKQEQKLAIVRSMPNTPAMIGVGATGLYANQQVKAEQKNSANAIFEAVGQSIWINDEQQMDLVTAISGSGPAHYFLFLEAVVNSAVQQGMSANTARQLASQTALGAAAMVQQQNLALTELRQQVTSPGGTTAAAIEALKAANFEQIIDNAIKSSVQRGLELAEIANNESTKTS